MSASTKFALVLPPTTVLQKLLTSWLEEDIPSFDIGAAIVGDAPSKAILNCKTVSDQIVLAGAPFVDCLFTQVLQCQVEWKYADGDVIVVPASSGKVPVAIVTGPCCQILQGERIALNLLARCSAIATVARGIKSKADALGYKGQIAGTRKTTPGFRLVEKYAMVVAGIATHRYDLSHMIMLKDNHIDSCQGSIEKCVAKAKQLAGFSTMIEVECRSKQDAERAFTAGAHVAMLDNFKPEQMKVVAKELKEQFPHSILEVSGGINISNVDKYICDHVDVISMGTLTQDVESIDFNLKIAKE